MLIACGVPDKLREFVGCFLRGPLLDGFSSMSSAKKKKNLLLEILLFCCQTRTRTQTDRTRICSATITPFGNIPHINRSEIGCKGTTFFSNYQIIYKKITKLLNS